MGQVGGRRMSDQRWVLAYEHDGELPSAAIGMTVEVGDSVLVGREGDLPLGVDVEDSGISREAALVTATEHGWNVEIRNRNRAMVHPWGQGPTLAGRHNTLTWPRVGIRILNGTEGDPTETRRHWLLLEADMIAPNPAGARISSSSTTSTSQPPQPSPLKERELAALQVVFADHLRWPPVSPPEAPKLDTAAHRLGISVSGVQKRLEGVIDRAKHLGLRLPPSFRSSDPEYLYVLVRAGYLPLPTDNLVRRRLN